jgi:hypothetical protein
MLVKVHDRKYPDHIRENSVDDTEGKVSELMPTELPLQCGPRIGTLSDIGNGLFEVAQETQAKSLTLFLVVDCRSDEFRFGIGMVDHPEH